MKRQSRMVRVNGHPVSWLGVNFWSRGGGPRMWTEYEPELVRRELQVMRDHGMTLTRSFFYWPDFMPTPRSLNEQAIENYNHFLDLHEQLGMTTIPTFIVGHMSGENWDPVWRDGRDLFGDVWFVARQAWYVRELTSRFAAHPAVAGWLLSNEIPIYADWKNHGVGTIRAEDVESWAQILIDAVRAGGGTQPVSIGDGSWGIEVTGEDNGFRIRDLAPLIDFHGPHVYRMETDVVRQHLAAAFVCELLDIGEKPVVLEEFGVTSDYVSEANAAVYYRQALHNSLLAGATGWIAWNNTDYDNLADRPPYSHHPFELHFGLTDVNGAPKAQAREVAAFAEVLRRIDVVNTRRPDADAAIVFSSFVEDEIPFTEPRDATIVTDVARQAYVAARTADIPVAIVREHDGLPSSAKLLIIPSSKQLRAPTWARLQELARGGATVFASVFLGEHDNQRGLWWPDLDRLFGVTKTLTYGIADHIVDDEVRVTFERSFGDIPAGAELVFAVAGNSHARSFIPVVADGAEVLAVDQHGNPVLLRHAVGDGFFVLCTYPLEYMAAITSGVNPDATRRVYDALATSAGVSRPVRVRDGRVMVGQLDHVDGRSFVWLVSQSAEALGVSPVVQEGRVLVDERGAELPAEVELAPYEVRVLELR